jgi:hypothetical protein
MKLDTIGSLFSGAWRRFQERFGVIMAIFLIPTVLLALSELLFVRHGFAAHFLGGFLYILGLILSIVASTAIISAIGKGTNFLSSYRAGFKLFWAYLWISILVMVVTLGGYILLIIPGIMLSLQLALIAPALVMEDKHGMAALFQSREYVKGYWWAFFGRSLLLLLVIGVAMLVIFAPVRLLLGSVVGLIAYFIVIVFITPFSVCYMYEIFDNLRRLKPNAAEDAMKGKHEFVKVAMVLGIVGMVFGVILLCFAIAFLPLIAARWSANGYQQTSWNNSQNPSDFNCPDCGDAGGGAGMGGQGVFPTSGPVGTMVTITDDNLNATNTILMNGEVAAQDVPLAADGTISFMVPSSLHPYCKPGSACPDFVLLVRPGDYDVSIKEDGSANLDEGTFTVTSNATGTDGILNSQPLPQAL